MSQEQTSDMTAMMTRCADMERSMSGGQMSAAMRKMMTECRAMDREMSGSGNEPVPDTHSR